MVSLRQLSVPTSKAPQFVDITDAVQREVEASGNVEQTREAYLEVIRRKTGALIATSCRLGGMLSDATPEHVGVLEAYGEALGMAFQLSDDIMDVTSSASELGKEPGVDMKEGVYTLPVLLALHAGADRVELGSLLSGGPPEGDRLARALAIVQDQATLAEARTLVAVEVDRARELASRLPDCAARTALLQLAEFLAVRCGARRP